MKLKDFIKTEIDIDVYDDYDESIGIAFRGAIDLTEEGKEEFKNILDFEIDFDFPPYRHFQGDECIILHIDDEKTGLEKNIQETL